MSYNVTTSLRSPPFFLLRKEEREKTSSLLRILPPLAWYLTGRWGVGEGETTRRIHIRIPAASMGQVKKRHKRIPALSFGRKASGAKFEKSPIGMSEP